MRSGASKCALASITFSADCSASELGAPSRRLEEAARQPAAEALGADRPGFAMAVDVEIGEAGAVRRVEQLGRLREVDQDVGLRRAAPARVAVLLGDGLVERRHPAAGFLQLRPQRLERGAVVLLQRREPLQRLGRERRAGIGGGPLDQPVQRIADVLGRIDGGGDQVLGFDGRVAAHRAPSSMRGARPISRSLKSIPCGGRAMRTRRPSRFQRHAQSRAAASPGSSPSASTITSRTSFGQIEGAQPGGRERRPGRMAGRQHGGEAGLDAFADHQHVAGLGEPHGAATARAEHHLLRIDRRLAGAVAGEEGAVDRQRRAVGAARHQRDHRRPDAARRMLQPGMEAERRRRRKMQPARGEIGLDQSAAAPASRTARWRARPRCAWHCRDPAGAWQRHAGGLLAPAHRWSHHNPRDRRVAMTACSQPAWQHTSTLPSSASQIDRLGSRSSCPGHGAIQPPPALRPPRASAMAQRSWRTSSAYDVKGSPIVRRNGISVPDHSATMVETAR